jgi:hypothetical protein
MRTSSEVGDTQVASNLLFSSSWHGKACALQKEMFECFSNLNQGAEVLNQTLTQLLLYYTRFLKLLLIFFERRKEPQPDWVAKLASKTDILNQIKEFAKSY